MLCMNISKTLLRITGWTVEISTPDYPQCLICVAPHTSNWDFILCELAYCAVGRKAGFLMKEAWFRWPLGYFFRAIGGIAVPKKRGTSLTDTVINKFKTTSHLTIAITPEGTRKANANWRQGILHIAREANVPLLLAAIDFKKKHISLVREFTPSGDIESDMRAIKEYYKQFTARYPQQFITDDQ